MISALTINGDLGIKISGKRKYIKRELNEVYIKGRIELYNDNILIVSERFVGRTLRKKIIEKWTSFYQLQRKHGVYFQIAYE
jgi:hypothetical protein